MEAGARDLLRRFSGGFTTAEVAGGDSDEIELGLSLGGSFGLQDAESSRLMRSSSIPAVLQSDFANVAPLARACSMPSEAEEEIRRRKEMQSMKRMEAKRKREGKRSLRRFDGDFEGGAVGKMRRIEAEENGVASQGSSSSGGSEFDSGAGQGIEFPRVQHASDFNTPSKALTTSKHNNHKASSVPTSSTAPASKSINGTVLRDRILFNENVLRKNEGEKSRNGVMISDERKNIMEEMPSVSTRGDGPNGRRIEGLLYRYEKGEVSIVCVCHGSFLTPAEFVKHAGGGDVAHPLRHIVVNPNRGSLL